MHCSKCGKECPNDAKFCDGCGAALAVYDNFPQENPIPGNKPDCVKLPGKDQAVACMVLGILSCLFPFIVILGIIGLVLASQSKKSGYVGGMRTAGFITSLIGLIFGIIAWIIIIIIIAYASLCRFR